MLRPYSRFPTFLLVFALSILGTRSGYGQENRALLAAKKPPLWRSAGEAPNPMRATLLSTILPGLGQLYNGRSVLPYVGNTPYGGIAYAAALYASFAGIIYMINLQGGRYNEIRKSYLAFENFDRKLTATGIQDIRYLSYDKTQLVDSQNFYRQERDRWIAGLIVFYIFFNVVEAYVTAELYGFNVSRNLDFGINIWPGENQSEQYALQINYTID